MDPKVDHKVTSGRNRKRCSRCSEKPPAATGRAPKEPNFSTNFGAPFLEGPKQAPMASRRAPEGVVTAMETTGIRMIWGPESRLYLDSGVVAVLVAAADETSHAEARRAKPSQASQSREALTNGIGYLPDQPCVRQSTHNWLWLWIYPMCDRTL